MAKSFLDLKLSKLEDYAGQHLFDEFELPPTDISEEVMSFMRTALERIRTHPLMSVREINPDVPQGDVSSIEVILCPPVALQDIFEMNDNTLGCHNITNPDFDPFGDESSSARGYRVLIGWDPAWVGKHIEDANPDNLEDGTMAWLITLSHELQHVVLFAENGALNSPADLESMEDEIGRDLFDISTGYGIRSLVIYGSDVWSENAERATHDMEAYVEQEGTRIAKDVFRDDLSPCKFLAISGISASNTPEPEFS